MARCRCGRKTGQKGAQCANCRAEVPDKWKAAVALALSKLHTRHRNGIKNAWMVKCETAMMTLRKRSQRHNSDQSTFRATTWGQAIKDAMRNNESKRTRARRNKWKAAVQNRVDNFKHRRLARSIDYLKLSSFDAQSPELN